LDFNYKTKLATIATIFCAPDDVFLMHMCICCSAAIQMQVRPTALSSKANNLCYNL